MRKRSGWKILFSIVQIFYFGGQAFGQQQNLIKIFATPDQYLYNTKSHGAYKKSVSFIEGKPWVVFSDRDDNISYWGPNSTFRKFKKKIKFEEKFYVIGESGCFVHVVKCDTLLGSYCAKNHMVDYGWMSKDNLLLSSRSLVYKGSMVPVKMFYVENHNDKTSNNTFSVDLSLSPKLSKGFSVNLSEYPYLFFYLFKITPSGYLIGNKEKYRPKDQTTWLGWLDKKALSEWQGEALEPNWDSAAIRERKQMDISPSVFKKSIDCFSFLQGGKNIGPIWSLKGLSLFQDSRLPGNYYRFPVLSESSECYISVYFKDKSEKRKMIPVYIPKIFNGLKYPLFKKVFFLSRYQLGVMVSEYSEIRDLYDIKGDWEQAVLLFAKRNFSEVDSGYLASSTWGMVTRYFWGYQSTGEAQNLKLKDLSASHLKDVRVKNIILHIDDKIKNLSKVFNSNDKYPYLIKMNGKLYYWINMDDLL